MFLCHTVCLTSVCVIRASVASSPSSSYFSAEHCLRFRELGYPSIPHTDNPFGGCHWLLVLSWLEPSCCTDRRPMLRDVYDVFLGLGRHIVLHSMLVRPHCGPPKVLWHVISHSFFLTSRAFKLFSNLSISTDPGVPPVKTTTCTFQSDRAPTLAMARVWANHSY